MVRSPSHTVVGGTELLPHLLLDEDLHLLLLPLLPQPQDRDQGQEDLGQPAVMAAAAALTGSTCLVKTLSTVGG